jgi:lipopolysaccharide export system protein LptA
VTIKCLAAFLLATGFALAFPAAAQQREATLLLLRSDARSPVAISAERVFVLSPENTVMFDGNVHITRANLSLQCSQLLVRYDAPKKLDDRTWMYLNCRS